MKRLVIFFAAVLVLFSSCSFNNETTATYSSGKYTLSLKSGTVVASQPWVVNIEKDPEEDFVVLNLTDIQLGTNDFYVYWDDISEMIDCLVEQADPDLIMVTGDVSYGCGPAFIGICSKINSYGIPWAPVYGNHDCENSGMSPDMQSKILQQFSNCLFRRGPENLAFDPINKYEQQGNYVVNIVSNSGSSFDVIRSFVMINSGTEGVTEIQRQWYIDCASSVRDGKVAVVMHIPTDGFDHAANAAFKNYRYSMTLEDSYTSEVWNSGYESSFGVQHEGIASSNSVPFKEYAEQTGNTDYFLCGHDHCNCTCIKDNGITYVFSLKTGPGCYFEEEMQGGTKLTISNDGSIVTEHIFY